MTVAGLIFSNLHDSAAPELTTKRTLASVPFGCRYRLIDFPLSNMVNSGITKVGIITHNNYQSLVDHISTGKDWDLARRSGGIKILPPFITAYDSQMSGIRSGTYLESLVGVTNFIARCTEDVIVLSDSDGICNIDLTDVLKAHGKSGADITIVTTDYTFADHEDIPFSANAVESDPEGNVTDIRKLVGDERSATITTNIIVANRLFLLNQINGAAARGYSELYRDVIKRCIGNCKIRTYHFDGTYILISSLRTYFEASMKLLDKDVRNELLTTERPIYTKVRNSAPTVYTSDAKVKNSYVADGCILEGEVENCIIFRGVKVGKGSKLRNCVLLQDTDVGDNVMMNCVVTDKNVTIRDGRMLSGHETMPFFLAKGVEV